MPKRGQLRVATCQFPVSADIRRNGRFIRAQMQAAKRKRADVAHFSECGLGGYGGVEYAEWNAVDWALLHTETQAILDLARRLKLWVVLGSTHRLSGRHRPHNALYVITPQGKILDRYDKRFCTGGDLKYYSPGDHFTTFTINGVKCGLLICYDVRFPELYREYQKRGVQCMFHSFYNARSKKKGIWSVIMTPTLQAHAGINYVWISANNASGYYQQWPSVLIQPDGVIAGKLTPHRAGVMVNVVDVNRKLYDASGPYRDRSMRGHFCSGTPVSDARSRNRKIF